MTTLSPPQISIVARGPTAATRLFSATSFILYFISRSRRMIALCVVSYPVTRTNVRSIDSVAHLDRRYRNWLTDRTRTGHIRFEGRNSSIRVRSADCPKLIASFRFVMLRYIQNTTVHCLTNCYQISSQL